MQVQKRVKFSLPASGMDVVLAGQPPSKERKSQSTTIDLNRNSFFVTAMPASRTKLCMQDLKLHNGQASWLAAYVCWRFARKASL